MLTQFSAGFNRAIGNQNAADIDQGLGNDAAPTMASHAVDLELLKKAWNCKKDFTIFKKDREERLKQAVITVSGSKQEEPRRSRAGHTRSPGAESLFA